MIKDAVKSALASGIAGTAAGPSMAQQQVLQQGAGASTSNDMYKARCDLLENALVVLTRNVDGKTQDAEGKIFFMKMLLTQPNATGSYDGDEFAKLIAQLFQK